MLEIACASDRRVLVIVVRADRICITTHQHSVRVVYVTSLPNSTNASLLPRREKVTPLVFIPYQLVR